MKRNAHAARTSLDFLAETHGRWRVVRKVSQLADETPQCCRLVHGLIGKTRLIHTIASLGIGIAPDHLEQHQTGFGRLLVTWLLVKPWLVSYFESWKGWEMRPSAPAMRFGKALQPEKERSQYQLENCTMQNGITTLIKQIHRLPAPSSLSKTPRRLKQLKHMIGNTPLLVIRFAFRGKERVIYAKAEHLNMTGSIKDRMAFHILKRAYQGSLIQPGETIAEATSGNTGISFAAIGRALGHQVVIFMPDWMSEERVALIKSLGAKIVHVRHDQGGFLGSIRMTEELAGHQPHVFLPTQFANEANVEAHEKTTGPEIWWQLHFHSIKPDAFVAGVGTGGTIMGVGRFLRQHNPAIRLHPLQPAESPTLTIGHQVGHHRIQGISDEFIPAILELEKLDSVVSVHDGDAILMAQKLAAGLGLAVGISSGANFLGALMVQNEMSDDAVVTTVFPDDNKKYLSTDLLREEPVNAGYLSPEVELLGYEAFKRACFTCFDGED